MLTPDPSSMIPPGDSALMTDGYRLLFETIKDAAVLLLDRSGVVAGWNQGAERIMGYSREEVLGRYFSMFYPPEEAAASKPAQVLQRTLAEGRYEFEGQRIRKNGSPFWATIQTTALFDQADNHLGFSVIWREKTTRNYDESALQRAELQFRSQKIFTETMIESMPGIVYFYDDRGRFLRWNRNFETVSGFSSEEIAGMHPLDFFRGDDKKSVEDRISEVFVSGESSVEADFITKDGTVIPYYFTGRKVVFQGRTCLVGMGIDLSEQKRALDLLSVSERKYRELVEHANSIILRWNSEGRVTMLNEFGLEFFGYTSEEILGRHVVGTIVPVTESGGRDLQRLMEEVCAAPETHEQSINENIRKNGERVWIAWTNRLVRDEEGRVVEILSIGADITARRRAEEARRESEARYRRLFECAPDGILIADRAGRYLDANASACQMLGYRREELIGLQSTEIVVETEIPNIGTALRTIEEDLEHRREWIFRRKDGTTFEAEVLAASMPDGNILGMIRDVSEKKAAEAEKNRRIQAEEADRIKSAFLATMSHELRTPLNSIIGFTGIILQGLAGPLNPEQAKQLDMVRTSARHLLALVNDVLDISKIEAGQLEVANHPYDLNRSIEKVLKLISPQAESKGLNLKAAVPEALPEAIGDERRFEQILLNLLSNAIKFTERGEVRLQACIIPNFRREDGDSPVEAIRVEVSDTGMGIRAEDLPSLFQPFRQIDSGLARNHEGTGLGLAICQRLTVLMGGDIHAESEWEKGSRFTVTLPLKGPDAK